MTAEQRVLEILAKAADGTPPRALRGIEITVASRWTVARGALGIALKRLAERDAIVSRGSHTLKIWSITDVGRAELETRRALKRGQRWRPDRAPQLRTM